ncbi:TlpA disulfide reductase family protein [Polynucleobacter sp. MWH-UH2A]|uniref:TlpA family protein disulfide reductase n=1 Tax=Polynucleobacter sp. MWH-UH2A TaxID=1855617 RepID=UPI001BFE537D|nr:TlpA disulfide reductase family protein [Polynucleobacter sp. MWH-UH2A]QWD64802.1 TlpA family protein disulfide reductase [Polynucleobacter sp. MWH-UH2A]
MKKFFLLISLICIFIQSGFAQSNSIKGYQRGDWKAITKPYASQAVIIHFWGVTCAPCAREMPQWGKFIAQNKNAKIIFIQVDDVSPDSASKMMSSGGLTAANAYTLASPFDDALRYEIDPKWRGETPMTLLIDKNGKVTRKTGTMDFNKLKQWYLVSA